MPIQVPDCSYYHCLFGFGQIVLRFVAASHSLSQDANMCRGLTYPIKPGEDVKEGAWTGIGIGLGI